MGMKLMSKKEVTTAAASVRKSEIDEGHKLAKQITGIRQTKAEEEASLEKFRSETVKNIKAQLEPLQTELEDTQKELVEAKKQRDELLVPLDKEWEAVELVKNEIAVLKDCTEKNKKEAEEDRKTAAEELVKAVGNNSRLLTLEEVARDAKNSAILLEREAQELKDEAARIEEKTRTYERASSVQSTEEYRILKVRKEAVARREKDVEDARIENERVKLQLEDERKTLERAFKRIKK